MTKVILTRQGVSETLQTTLPSGCHLEIRYHHGSGYWQYTKTTKTPGATPEHLPRYSSTWCARLSAKSIEEAISETAAQLRNIEFEPWIEAYCYSNAKTLELWPHVATDKYITSATYEPGTDSIRHEPSNVYLIIFDKYNKASMYQDDAANRKYKPQITEAIKHYNSNIKAHGKGRERKEWLAWLVGQYIRSEHSNERPVVVDSIARA